MSSIFLAMRTSSTMCCTTIGKTMSSVTPTSIQIVARKYKKAYFLKYDARLNLFCFIIINSSVVEPVETTMTIDKGHFDKLNDHKTALNDHNVRTSHKVKEVLPKVLRARGERCGRIKNRECHQAKQEPFSAKESGLRRTPRLQDERYSRFLFHGLQAPLRDMVPPHPNSTIFWQKSRM